MTLVNKWIPQDIVGMLKYSLMDIVYFIVVYKRM